MVPQRLRIRSEFSSQPCYLLGCDLGQLFSLSLCFLIYRMGITTSQNSCEGERGFQGLERTHAGKSCHFLVHLIVVTTLRSRRGVLFPSYKRESKMYSSLRKTVLGPLLLPWCHTDQRLEPCIKSPEILSLHPHLKHELLLLRFQMSPSKSWVPTFAANTG